MSKVYISAPESAFAAELAKLFEQEGFRVVSEPQEGVEYFIDLTDAYVPGDDRRVGEGFDPDAAVLAYHLNVSEPLARLSAVLDTMVGKKRICFINNAHASINYSADTVHYGHNMSKAALNLILVLTKNGLTEKGFTFRLFDPMTGTVEPAAAAKSAFAYFTRDRFFDDPLDGLDRNDELNLILRDALGREIPW